MAAGGRAGAQIQAVPHLQPQLHSHDPPSPHMEGVCGPQQRAAYFAQGSWCLISKRLNPQDTKRIAWLWVALQSGLRTQLGMLGSAGAPWEGGRGGRLQLHSLPFSAHGDP